METPFFSPCVFIKENVEEALDLCGSQLVAVFFTCSVHSHYLLYLLSVRVLLQILGIALREKHRISSCETPVTTAHAYFHLKTPYLIHVCDSLALHS